MKNSEDNFSILEVLNTIGKGMQAFAGFINQLEAYLKRPDVTKRILAFAIVV